MSATIISLKYGDVEVTDAGGRQRVKDAIETFTPFVVNNATMGKDTLEGKVKQMFVEYSLNGRTARRQVTEGQTVNFRVFITGIKYGMEDKFYDYDNYYGSRLDLIQAIYKIIDLGSKFTVTNSSVLSSTSDDPTPGKVKRLVVDYVRGLQPGRGYPQSGVNGQDYKVDSITVQEGREVSFPSMGSSAPVTLPSGAKNIWYVEVIPADTYKDQLEKTQANVWESIYWLAQKTASTVKVKVDNRELDPNRAWNQENYAVKVQNYFVSNSPWWASMSMNNQPGEFNTSSKDLHDAILNKALAGLGVSAAYTQIEKVLRSIGSTIAGNSGENWPTFWICFIVYVKDEVLRDMRTYMRTIMFSTTKETAKAIQSKAQTENVSLRVPYSQSDIQFNEQVYIRNARDAIRQLPADDMAKGKSFVDACKVKIVMQ